MAEPELAGRDVAEASGAADAFRRERIAVARRGPNARDAIAIAMDHAELIKSDDLQNVAYAFVHAARAIVLATEPLAGL